MKNLNGFFRVLSIIGLMLFVGSCSRDQDVVLENQPLQKTEISKDQARTKVEELLELRRQYQLSQSQTEANVRYSIHYWDSDDIDWFVDNINSDDYRRLSSTLDSYRDSHGVYIAAAWNMLDEWVYARGNIYRIYGGSPFKLPYQVSDKGKLLWDYQQKAKYIKKHGFSEQGSNYLSLLDDLVAESYQSIYPFYETVWNAYKALRLVRFIRPWAEVVEIVAVPALDIILTEMGTTFAIKAIQKIPVKWVLRGARLNRFVKATMTWGKGGENSRIRVIKNSSYEKAKETFKTLTRDAISFDRSKEGVVVAKMGNGNTINLRNFGSYDGRYGGSLKATIDFKGFGWSKQREVKFIGN